MLNKQSYLQIVSELEVKGVKLVAVSKRQPGEKITEIFELGQRLFGENRAADLLKRYSLFPKTIEWHMIGHLQTNKIKLIAPFVYMIQSIDSLNLLQSVNKEALKNNRVIDCLLEVFIAKEETKSGFEKDEIKKMFDQKNIFELKNIRICGLMGMASFTDDKIQVGKEFGELRKLFNELKNSFINDMPDFKILSMGMSDDYKIAISEGSNMVRLGTLLFGERQHL